MQPHEAETVLAEALIVDVREPYEFAAGHLDGSLNIPIGEIGARFEELRTDQPVLVVCQVGQRSGLVADFLCQQGMDAHNLEGGLARWAAEGHTLTFDGGEGTVVDGWARDLTGGSLHPDPSS